MVRVFTYRVLAAVILVVVALSGVGVSAQTHHVLGDGDDWGPTLNVSSWLTRRVFRVGDRLWFKHSLPEESIAEVPGAEEYESCDLKNPIEMYTDHVHLDKPGTRYFVSSNLQNCKNGLKLPVSVQPNPEFGPFYPVSPDPEFGPQEPFQPGPGFGPMDPVKPDPDFMPPEPFHPAPEYEPPEPFHPVPEYEPPEPFHPAPEYEPPSRYDPPGGYEPPSEYEPPVKPDLPPPPPSQWPSAATKANAAGLSAVLFVGLLICYLGK